MEKKTEELLFVLEDQKKALERLFTANPEFKEEIYIQAGASCIYQR